MSALQSSRRTGRLAADDVPDAGRRAGLGWHVFSDRRSRYGRPAFTDVLRDSIAVVPRGARRGSAQNRRCADASGSPNARIRGGRDHDRSGGARPDRAEISRYVRSAARRHARRAEVSERAALRIAAASAGDGRSTAMPICLRARLTRDAGAHRRKAASTIISAAASRATRSTTKWLVPHFEKMLYDNAQLLELLPLAFEQTSDPLYRERAHETVTWLAQEMTIWEGAFCASLDAEL